MPFTFSHPAIVLPLNRFTKKWLSLTGLIIGSMVPDFEYFIRMNLQSIYSHSLTGLFYFNLPLGILLTYWFHYLIKDTLVNISPKWLQIRLINRLSFNWHEYMKKNWVWVCISILAGAVSHILWDSFTHKSRIMIRILPSLQTTISLFYLQLPVYKIIQHISTVLGGFFLLIEILRLPHNNKKNSTMKPNLRLALILLFTSIFIFIIRLYLTPRYNISGHLVAGIIGAILFPLTVISGWIKLKKS